MDGAEEFQIAVPFGHHSRNLSATPGADLKYDDQLGWPFAALKSRFDFAH
jgi:hypothetical protein